MEQFGVAIGGELHTYISQSQPKMLVLSKQVVLSVDAHLDQPEARRVTFYTSKNNIFYLELATDSTEFVRLYDFVPQEAPNPDELMEQTAAQHTTAPAPQPAKGGGDSATDELLRSLGM